MKKKLLTIFIVLVLIIGSFPIGIFGFMLLRAVWPYPRENRRCNLELNQYYEKDKNIILPENLVKVKFNPGDITGVKGRGCEYDWKDINVFKSKHLRIEDVIYKDEVHKLGEYAYIGNEYLYDKSKGNHFEKIEEYIERNKEKLYDVILGGYWKKGINISFRILILNKIDDKHYYWDNRKFIIENHLLKEVGEYDDKEYINKKEKEFFKEKVKYEEIDWGKYIPSVGDYPVLIMIVDYEYKKGDIDNFELDQKHYRYKELQEIYKELEKWYNKETFDFVIWD